MDKFISVQPTSQAAIEYEAMIEQLLSEMTQLNKQMSEDRSDINRLKMECGILKAETRALLSSIGAKF